MKYNAPAMPAHQPSRWVMAPRNTITTPITATTTVALISGTCMARSAKLAPTSGPVVEYSSDGRSMKYPVTAAMANNPASNTAR